MSHDFTDFPGTKRYAPLRLLGVGGMGAVYEVEDRATGGHVALKVMLADDPRRLLRFKHEFRVMAELHHRNLVRLFDLGQLEGRWFFTMELVHGQDLLEVLLQAHEPPSGQTTSTAIQARDALAEDDAPDAPDAPDPPHAERGRLACDAEALVSVVAQILDALEFLHGRGILHRDLKPSNILVDLDGAVRVLDFGLASRIDRALAISQEGAVVGTLAYLSPEQYRGEPASAASDLYALGCMMFQLLTGALPFQGTPLAALAARCEEPPPRVDERVPDAPPLLVAIVHRLMAREPAERPTIAEIRDALGAAPGPRAAGPPSASGERLDTTVELFVGRQRELSVLAGCLERAARGEAQLALVSGPSGIGKSALAAVMVRRAQRLGFLCFQGRCYEREQVPFVAFDRAMDAMTLTLRAWPRARLAPLQPSLRVLARIFPALHMLLGEAPDDAGARPGADPRELRRQAVDGFRQLCVGCQAEAPLCFVLDDLQWADDESVELLSALLAGDVGRIMVLGSFRSDAARADDPLQQLLREVGASGRASRLALDALGSADAVHLVEAVTGSSLEPGMAEALASQTEGNPFLVRRLAEHLSTLAPAQRTARLDAMDSVGDLLGEMIGALSPRAEQALALAATAGGNVAAVVLRAASGLGREDFDLAVGELMAVRFLKAVPTAEALDEVGEVGEALPCLDLYHDRIREAAYQGLDDDRRRALHRSLGLAFEARFAAQRGGRGRDAEVLVRHFRAAGDRDRCRRYAVEAAEQAAAKLAFLRAARLFRVALDDPEPGEPALVTAARWERTGELFEYGGLHLEAARAHQEALRRWDEAPEAHPDRPVARLRLCGLAGANLMATDRVAEGRAVFEGGLALLGLPLDRPQPQRIAVLAALEARRRLAARFEGAERRGRVDPLAATEVRFFDLMVRAFQPFWSWPAAEAALRAELLGRRLDDKRVLQRSLAFGAAVPVMLGRCSAAQLDRAHQTLDAADELARAHELPLGRELVQLNRSLLWLATSMTRARRTCEAALEGFARRGLSESFDGDVGRVYYLHVLLCKGDDDDVLAAVARELSLPHANFVNVAYALLARATVLARRGRRAELRDDLDRVRSHLAGASATRLGDYLAGMTARVLIGEGRFAEVLADAEAHERAARACGAWAVGRDRALWHEIQLEAALGMLRRIGLPAPARRRARAEAAYLVERGVLDFGCMGYRALALLDHAEGRPRAAGRALRRALALSSVNTSPHHRWLCLEAARDLRAITLDQETEAAELGAAGRFVLPVGWGGWDT